MLLLRKSLDNPQRSTLLRTSKTAARVVLSCIDEPFKLKLRRGQKSYFASLLTSVSAAGSDVSRGSQIHLTLSGGYEHCLPKASITQLCFASLHLTREQWAECMASLQHYPSLKRLCLQHCKCTGLDICQDISIDNTFPLPVRELVVQDKRADICDIVLAIPVIGGEFGGSRDPVLSFVPISSAHLAQPSFLWSEPAAKLCVTLCMRAGALAPRCFSICSPASVFVPWVTGNVSSSLTHNRHHTAAANSTNTCL